MINIFITAYILSCFKEVASFFLSRTQVKKREISALVADTFDGKTHIESDPQAQVTPLGQLPIFLSSF